MSRTELNLVRRAVQAALDDGGPCLLAVSGGLDSMCLLDAAAATLDPSSLIVATFDHRSGAHARHAARFVQQRARELGLAFRPGRADRAAETEAAWRDLRWAFLRSEAKRLAIGTRIVTAHTRDDQVETVLIRIMRDAGARGIAGLFVDSDARDVVRPLLGISRAELERYARAGGVRWLEDPTNSSMRHLRNRIRRDLLPSMRTVNPSIDEDLLDLSTRAADWRRSVETFVEQHVSPSLREAGESSGLDVSYSSLAEYSQRELGALWPAIAARAGLALDHRGTRRLAAFTRTGKVGSRVPLSGGWEVTRSRHRFELRRVGGEPSVPDRVELAEITRWGRWSFSRIEGTRPSDAWTAQLPSDRPITVRRWLPGDTMVPSAGRSPRKVKRLLSSAGVTGHDRVMWPVVLAGDEIVWIPGVRRNDAASVWTGEPALTYRCEFNDR